MKKMNVSMLTLTALLSALSAVLMTINFPLPLAPGFLKFDIAEFPGLFAGFFMGPLASVTVIVLKNILKILLQGSETMYVGELMNVIGSIGYTLPAALIYRRYRTKKGALIALSAAVGIGSLLAVLLNLYVAFPMYGAMYGLAIDDIVRIGTAANPLVTDLPSLMVLSVLPFNLVKLAFTSAVTWVLYKRLGSMLTAYMGKYNAVKPEDSHAAFK